MSEHKVGRKKNPTIFWPPVGTYCLNNDNFIFKNWSKSGNFGTCLSQKILFMSSNGFFFFGCQMVKIHQKQTC
jgi:hypothetical protein